MAIIGQIGARTLSRVRFLAYICGMAYQTVRLSIKPSFWAQPIRNVLARQILFTGFEAVRFISLIAFLVGVSLVAQVHLWLTRFGQTELLGSILVSVVVAELGPLLTNFVVIGRSGAAIATELGNMQVTGEVRVLDAQGLDPFPYLVVPRVVGMMVSVFCLTIVFIVVCLAAGFLVGLLLGVHNESLAGFVDNILRALQPADIAGVLAKTWIPGMLTGVICCAEGMSVRGAITEVPQATTRALVKSVAALFLVSALVSLLAYTS